MAATLYCIYLAYTLNWVVYTTSCHIYKVTKFGILFAGQKIVNNNLTRYIWKYQKFVSFILRQFKGLDIVLIQPYIEVGEKPSLRILTKKIMCITTSKYFKNNCLKICLVNIFERPLCPIRD